MMDKDFSKLKLTDIGFGTFSYWSFYNKFLKLGINTVEQVLDDELMDYVLSHTQKKGIRDEIRGFIDLVKCEFLGKELTTTSLLDEPASKLIVDSDHDNPVNFGRMGFRICSHPDEKLKLSLLYYNYLHSHDEKDENPKIIDVFRYNLERVSSDNELYKKLKIMVNSYDRVIDRSVSLEILKRDVEQLKLERSKLDEKIKNLEEQIAAIKGGITR